MGLTESPPACVQVVQLMQEFYVTRRGEADLSLGGNVGVTAGSVQSPGSVSVQLSGDIVAAAVDETKHFLMDSEKIIAITVQKRLLKA